MMAGFLPLLKKEMREQLRTFRLPALAIVFLVSALLSILTILYLPEIIKMSAPELQITLPDPTAPQALLEFMRSATQVGTIAVILVGMGLVARERERGTALLVLAKPVSLSAFVLAKLVALSISVALVVSAATGLAWLYSVWLLPGDIPARAAGMVALLTLYFVYAAVVTVGFSCMFKSQLAAAGLALVTLLASGLAAGIPNWGNYLPEAMLAWGRELVAAPHADPRWAGLSITVAVAALILWVGLARLRRSEL